jgi:hypothetical protein
MGKDRLEGTMCLSYTYMFFFVEFGLERIIHGRGCECGFFNVGTGAEMEQKRIGGGFKQLSNMCIHKELYVCQELI